MPTWNYVAVHTYGGIKLIDDPEPQLDILRSTVSFFEQNLPERWRIDLTSGLVPRLLSSIIGFRIEITRIEGKWKLSQNHRQGRRNRVIRKLEEQSGELSRGVASAMKEVRAV